MGEIEKISVLVIRYLVSTSDRAERALVFWPVDKLNPRPYTN